MKRAKLIRNIILLVLVYGLVCGGVYLGQTKLMYHPDTAVQAPEAYGLPELSADTLTTEDGETLQLWYAKAKANQPTVVYFHGNAGHLGYRHVTFRALLDAGFGLVAVDWRGFGASTGVPSEAGLMRDAYASVRFTEKSLGIRPQDMILYGESLGSGIAVRVAAELSEKGQAPALVVLQAPYTSVATRAAEIYFYLPVHWLIRDRYESLERLKQVHSPVLILHGDADRVIPIHHGKAMFEAANAPKRALFYPNIGHFGFPLQEMTQVMHEMIRKN